MKVNRTQELRGKQMLKEAGYKHGGKVKGERSVERPDRRARGGAMEGPEKQAKKGHAPIVNIKVAPPGGAAAAGAGGGDEMGRQMAARQGMQQGVQVGAQLGARAAAARMAGGNPSPAAGPVGGPPIPGAMPGARPPMPPPGAGPAGPMKHGGHLSRAKGGALDDGEHADTEERKDGGMVKVRGHVRRRAGGTL